MKHLFLSCFFCFFAITYLSSQETKKVLFIGNSYTYYNDLPNMIAKMALSTGDTLIHDSSTPGGARLMDHVNNGLSLEKINSKVWDYVTLQGQSQESSLSSAQLKTEVHPYVKILCEAIRDNDLCSVPMFYMTWGYEDGDDSNCRVRPWVCTYKDMDNEIHKTYSSLALKNEAALASVGATWRYLRTKHPNIDLYAKDGSHPSLAGSFAAACTFYSVIYKKDPTLITWNSTLFPTEALLIKRAAKLVIYDELQKNNPNH